MTDKRPIATAFGPHRLAGWSWDGDAARDLVLFHAGVCDSRSWDRVAPELTDLGSVWAYDRPGYGVTPTIDPRPNHVEVAAAFLSANLRRPAWLVASSMGGAVALDVAVARPDLVAGLVLLAPAVTGGPELDVTPEERELDQRASAALSAGDPDEANRFEIWYWLDGPAQAEGRVGGATRVLALEMNRELVGTGAESGFDETVDAWAHAPELRMPVTVAVGEYEESAIRTAGRALAGRIPGGRYVELAGTAHLPYLDSPDQVIEVVRAAVTASP